MADNTASRSESGLLPEIRCQWCNRLLFKGRVEWVEIKCPKCRRCQTFARCGAFPRGGLPGGGKTNDGG